jgi:hypothetical protein
MALSGQIGSLFVVTLDQTTSGTVASEVTLPRGLTVEYITLTITASAGAGTATIESSTDGASYTDMFGGAVNIEINNVTLVAQSTGSGAGTMMLVPTAGASIAGPGGTLRITIGGNNHSYRARFFCSAASPEALTVS